MLGVSRYWREKSKEIRQNTQARTTAWRHKAGDAIDNTVLIGAAVIGLIVWFFIEDRQWEEDE